MCEDDRAIPVQVQDAMVQKCREEGAEMETERVWSGHSPFLSKTEEVVGWLRGVAGVRV